MAQDILTTKPGKPLEEINSYGPISLLPIFSKDFEKFLMGRLKSILATSPIIPELKEQTQGVVNQINNDLEVKSVAQAFDKV